MRKICILINLEENKCGNSFIRLYYNAGVLQGAVITIRDRNIIGEENGDAQTKLAHELGHVIEGLFEEKPVGLDDEMAAWKWAEETGVQIQKWVKGKALKGYKEMDSWIKENMKDYVKAVKKLNNRRSTSILKNKA